MKKKYSVLIWGTGKIAKRTVKYNDNWEIIGYIESTHTIDWYDNKKVYLPENLPESYDFIIVASTHATEILNLCKRLSIPLDRMIFLCGAKQQVGLMDLGLIKDILGEDNYTLYCAEYGIIEKSFFEQDMYMYSKLNNRKNFEINDKQLWPILTEKYEEAGLVHNYFLQDLWAAKKILKNSPEAHFDIGSRLDGFIAHLLSAGILVKMIDIRPFPAQIEGLETIVDDATELKNIEDESIDSFSALCSLEHFGLGRYGDPIDPEACFKCFESIQKKIKNGGSLYLSVPIGKEKVEFNAHRVFYASTIIDCFDQMEMLEYSCAAEKTIEKNVPIHKYDKDPHNGEYRYGLFEFVKK